MGRAPLALKPPPSFGQAQAFWERERAPRSPDDPEFQQEVDDLTDPLKYETFFRSAAYVWFVKLFVMLVVSLPFVFLIWRFFGVLSVLNRALSGMAAGSGLP
ncbi:MAG: hypothetical protein ACLQDM_26245 [Bradyrhizobium sp.]